MSAAEVVLRQRTEFSVGVRLGGMETRKKRPIARSENPDDGEQRFPADFSSDAIKLLWPTRSSWRGSLRPTRPVCHSEDFATSVPDLDYTIRQSRIFLQRNGSRKPGAGARRSQQSIVNFDGGDSIQLTVRSSGKFPRVCG